MNSRHIVIHIALVILFCNCSQNDTPAKQWYKGNLHTHSYWSDGDEFPEVIMDWYKTNGYQFVALSEHNILAMGEKWKTISPDSIYQKGFRNYLAKYGTTWVEYETDSLDQLRVKLKTLKEYSPLFEEKDKFLILPSEEITDRYDKKPLHLNASNIQEKIDPQGGNSIAEVLQNNIDAVWKQRNESGVPMIVHVNHPNFGYAIGLQDMIALRNERFFEVFNGHNMVHNMGDSSHLSTEMMWDLINRSYLEDGKELMYGLATDDSHHYHSIGKEWSNAGRGWIQVRAVSLDPRSIIEAMEAGEFYASTGVEIKSLNIENNHIRIEIKRKADENYTIRFIGIKKGQMAPEELSAMQGDEANFKLTDDILFVRCKITSSKLLDNPVEDFLHESAWTQPVIFEKIH